MWFKNNAYNLHTLSLTAFLLYLNFTPQRIELFLTDKLNSFPFPYALLIGFLLLYIFDQLIIKKKLLLDKKIRVFIFMVLTLIMMHSLSLLCITVSSWSFKGTWFHLLSMAYIYVPICTAVYVYLIVDNIHKFNYFVKLFFIIIFGQIIIGFLMLYFQFYIGELMGWEVMEHAAIRSTSSIIGGTGPLAFLFLVATPLTFAYYIQRGSSYLILLAILSISLVFTYSRAPLFLAFFSIVLMSSLLLLKYRQKNIHRKVFVVAVSAFAIVIVLVVGTSQVDMDYLFRKDVDDADVARLESSETAMTLTAEKPFLGYGPGELYIRKYERSEEKHIIILGNRSLKTPHNLYLLFAAENGFIFFMLWLIFLAVSIKLLSIGRNKYLSHKIISMGFISSVTAAYIYSIITDQLATQYRMSPTFWFIVGLGMAFSKLTSQHNAAQNK